MKKLQNYKLENLQGGISCHDMFDVFYILSQTQNGQAQLQSLSGLTLQCTDSSGNMIAWQVYW